MNESNSHYKDLIEKHLLAGKKRYKLSRLRPLPDKIDGDVVHFWNGPDLVLNFGWERACDGACR